MSSHLVVSGVSGSGKNAVGEELARRLDVEFADGDDFHSQANRSKMSAGVALDDEDRWPWLEQIGDWLEHQDQGAVMACSALKRSYRDLLREHCSDVWVVQLTGDPGLIKRRQEAREQHFMPPELMDSQFATLEPLGSDEAGVVVDVAASVEEIVSTILDAL